LLFEKPGIIQLSREYYISIIQISFEYFPKSTK
jgi:hypothetical protein